MTVGTQLDAELAAIIQEIEAIKNSGVDLSAHLVAIETAISSIEPVDLTGFTAMLTKVSADLATLRAEFDLFKGGVVVPTPEPQPEPDPAPTPNPDPEPTPDPVPDPTPAPEPEPQPDPVLPVNQAQFTLVTANNMSQNATGQGPTQWMEPDFNWPADGDMTKFNDGDAYIRLNVRQKPSNLWVAAQLCMWNQTDGSTFNSYEETCSPWRDVTFTETGVIYAKWRPPVSWYNAKPGPRTPIGAFPWTEKPHVLRLFIKPVINKATGQPAQPSDTNLDGSLLLANRNAGASKWNVSDAEINKHLPIVADFEVILVKKGQPFRPPVSWTDNPWSGDQPPVVDPAPPVVEPTPPPVIVEPTPEPPVVVPNPTPGAKFPAELTGQFLFHGENWSTYQAQVAQIDPILANRMGKYNFGTLTNNRSLFNTAPAGWTTGDTLDLINSSWTGEKAFGYKLQLPVTNVKYTGSSTPNEATIGIGVEAWRASHPDNARAKAWLVTFGKEIADLQRAGKLNSPMPITLMHENLGSYAFILGHTVNPLSAKEWKVTGGPLPHTPEDYAGFFRFASDTIKEQGANILAVYSPNAVRADTQPLAAACVAALGDAMDVYGMSAYPHSGNVMASKQGYDEAGINPSPAQIISSLEYQCEFIRSVTDVPIMVNEFGFNPTRSHTDDNGRLVTTNAAPVELLIPDYFRTAAANNIVQLWYFNADKINGKEAFDILDDGNGSQHAANTKRILISSARKWSDTVKNNNNK